MGIDSVTKQLGIIKKGDSVAAEFKITNAGATNLNLTSVFIPCGCVLAENDKVVMPGGSGSVKVTLETTDLEGAISKTIYLTTNDPVRKVSKLYISATVKPRIKIEPSTLINVILTRGQKQETTFTLSSAEAGFFPKLRGITDIVPGSTIQKYVQVEIKEAQINMDINADPQAPAASINKTYAVNILMSPEAPDGEVNQRITLETGIQDPATVELNVVGIVQPRFIVIPERVSLGPVKAGVKAVVSKNVIFINNSKTEMVAVSKVDLIALPEFSVQVTPIHDGSIFNIVLVGKALTPGVYDGRLKVHVDGQSETIDIPVHVAVM
jgi:hypothetical protein